MISNLNIILIFLFVLVAVALIGFGIINLIDRKISNVAVNIPPIKITQPNLTLTVSKEDANKIQLCTCGNNSELEFNYDGETKKETVTQGIEGFANIKQSILPSKQSGVKSDYVIDTKLDIKKPYMYDIKGFNYMDFENIPSPFVTNQMRILNKNMRGLAPEHVNDINVPEAWNFAFQNI